MDTYLDVPAAMRGITVKFKAWFDNRLFLSYLGQLSSDLARKAVISVSGPVYMHRPSLKKNTLGDTPRYLSTNTIFQTVPKSITSALTMPPEPKLSVPQQKTTRRDAGTGSRLEQLCSNLEGCAKSKCDKDYIKDLRASCVSLGLQEFTTHMPDILATKGIRMLFQEYMNACEKYVISLNNSLAQAVKENGSSSDQLEISIQHSPRMSPMFWLAQLHRDRFYYLSNAWKSAIIEYGLAFTQFHRAQQLAAVCGKPVELAEELRHIGHSNWDPWVFPETLLLEVESGIMVRPEQEFIASQMRDPAHNDNAVFQLLMGSGKSSTILPVLATNLTDGQK